MGFKVNFKIQIELKLLQLLNYQTVQNYPLEIPLTSVPSSLLKGLREAHKSGLG